MKTIKMLQSELGGRPKSKNKKVRVSVYISPAQLQLLQEYSDKNMISLSHYLRDIIMQKIQTLTKKEVALP